MTFLFTILSRDVVYKFPSPNRITSLINSIPPDQKEYCPGQVHKIAFNYTNKYTINGTQINYDGFCSFPFFSGGYKQVATPFYYVFFWDLLNEYAPLEKSNTWSAPLRKFSSGEAHGLYINGFLDLIGRPIDLTKCSIKVVKDESAKCISGFCDPNKCDNPYHTPADRVGFKIEM